MSTATARIRYTRGPDQLGFGPYLLNRGEWVDRVDNALALEAVLPGRVDEYGFEAEGHITSAPPAAAAPDAAARRRGGAPDTSTTQE